MNMQREILFFSLFLTNGEWGCVLSKTKKGFLYSTYVQLKFTQGNFLIVAMSPQE